MKNISARFYKLLLGSAKRAEGFKEMDITKTIVQELYVVSRTIPYDQIILIRHILSGISGKWSLRVLAVLALAGGTLRFSAIFKELTGISYKVLTQTLKDLERDGLITKHTHKHQVPPRADYELSPLGENLLQVIAPLWKWLVSSADQFEEARKDYARVEITTPN